MRSHLICHRRSSFSIGIDCQSSIVVHHQALDDHPKMEFKGFVCGVGCQVKGFGSESVEKNSISLHWHNTTVQAHAQGFSVKVPFFHKYNTFRLLCKRIIRCGGAVDDDMANIIVAQLLYIDAVDPNKDIVMAETYVEVTSHFLEQVSCLVCSSASRSAAIPCTERSECVHLQMKLQLNRPYLTRGSDLTTWEAFADEIGIPFMEGSERVFDAFWS